MEKKCKTRIISTCDFLHFSTSADNNFYKFFFPPFLHSLMEKKKQKNKAEWLVNPRVRKEKI